MTTKALPVGEVPEFSEPTPQGRKEDSPGVDYSLLRVPKSGAPVPSPREVQSVVQVEVEDTGPGIPPEALSKIFDPFYSTKPPGEGTGLGLAICLRILESYGGRIFTESEKGKGTRFTILLPIFNSIGHREHSAAQPQTKKQ